MTIDPDLKLIFSLTFEQLRAAQHPQDLPMPHYAIWAQEPDRPEYFSLLDTTDDLDSALGWVEPGGPPGDTGVLDNRSGEWVVAPEWAEEFEVPWGLRPLPAA